MTDQQTLARFAAARDSLQPVETWQAWKLGERESYPLPIPEATSLDETVSDALFAISWQPGDILAVQQSHTGRGKFTLWQFTVRRSTKIGAWRDSTDGGRKVFVGRLETKPIGVIALAAPFQPVEPFDAFRDDPVGRDLTLVER